MKYQIPENILNLNAYHPVDSNSQVKMDANEGCFPIPSEILEKFKTALNNFDFNRYPDPMAKKASTNFGEFYNVDPNHVVLGNGSDELLFLIITCMAGKNQKLLTFAPDFSMYKFYAELGEVNHVTVAKPEKVENFNKDFIINAIKQHDPSLILFSNPCNPTSHEITTDEVKEILNSTDALVILDEAYMDFGEESFLPYYQDFDNLIILKTASKGLGFANARLGFFISSNFYVDLFRKFKSPYNVNGITQLLGEILFEDKELIQQRIDLIKSERQRLFIALSPFFEISKPAGNFLFAKHPNSSNIKAALMEKGVAIKDFGGYLRITVGTVEENDAFLQGLKEIGIIS